MSLLVLSASDISKVISRFTPDELAALMASVFSQLSSSDPAPGTIHQPHRTSVPTKHHTALFMPSRIASAGTAIKVVSVPTDAAPHDVKRRGLPASTVVLDETTGAVRAIVNAKLLTALRNAAEQHLLVYPDNEKARSTFTRRHQPLRGAIEHNIYAVIDGSLLSTRLLLSADSLPKCIVAVGAGAQIQAHLSLFLSAYPSIHLCTILNRSQNARLDSLVNLLCSAFPLVRIAAGSLSPPSRYDGPDLRETIGRANIIITATSSTTPLFPSKYVKPNTHICLIGSYKPEMHEIDTDLVKRAGKVAVDQKSAALEEAGELLTAGLTELDLVEIGRLYDCDTDTRGATWTPRTDGIQDIRSSGDVTIFKSVGLGIQDVVIACAVVDRAVQEGIGMVVENYDD